MAEGARREGSDFGETRLRLMELNSDRAGGGRDSLPFPMSRRRVGM